jgi:hypothetical protein
MKDSNSRVAIIAGGPAGIQAAGRSVTVAGQRRGEQYVLRALPDCRREILRDTADDQHFIHHWRCSGHLASNGRLVEWEGCTWARVEDGLIAEAWIFADPSDPRLE